MRSWHRIPLAVLLAAVAGIAQADCRGPVLKVPDGDSLVVRCDGRERDLRLAGIDAPEYRQRHGQRARQALAELVAGREVEVEALGVDDYDRLLAQVFVDGRNVNRELLRRGHAWAYRRYLRDPRWIDDEAYAREQRFGLWRDADPQPPWAYRAAVRRK